MKIRSDFDLREGRLKQLEKALNSAFPTYDEMKRMYRLTFDRSLDLPFSGTLAFKIIEQAESRTELKQLLEGAYAENPTNQMLKAFVASVQVVDNSPPQDKDLDLESKDLFYFEPSVLIGDITPEHIMDIRATNHKDFYYERDFDSELFDLAVSGKNILLLGNSLAGKTRAVFELVKKLESTYPSTVILFPKNKPIKDVEINIPFSPVQKHIAFIEDIDDYYKDDVNVKKYYDRMIKSLLRAGVQIFATCRTGPEYKEYKRLSNVKVREAFTKVTVGKVRRDVVMRFDESITGDLDQGEFDGNIGSLFMEIAKMKDRYELLKEDDSPESSIAISVMRSLKTFYFASNFTGKSAYDADAVKDYCLRLCVSKNASPSKMFTNAIGEQFALQERENLSEQIAQFEKNLQTALSLLESDEDNLNFIWQETNKLKVEEVYLEKIVRYSPFKLIKDIDRLYDARGEKKKNGFYVKTKSYNKLLKTLPYDAASSMYYEMRKKRVMPNADSYSFLIEKSDSYQTALEWLNKLKRFEIPPNESVLMAMVDKATSFEEAFIYLDPMLDLLSSKDEDQDDIDYQYQLLTGKFLRQNQKLTKNQVEQYFDAYHMRLISISSFVFNRVVGYTVGDIIGLQDCLNWIKLYDIEPDVMTLKILMSKSLTVLDAIALLNEDAFNEVEIDEFILNSLLEKTSSQSEALGILGEDQFKNVKISGATLSRLIEKSSSLEVALNLLEREIFRDAPLGESILYRLIERASSLEVAVDLVNKDMFSGIAISSSTLNCIVGKAETLQAALAFLENEKFAEIQLGLGVLNRLLEKANTLTDALGVLNLDKFKDCPLDKNIFIRLLESTDSLEEALDFLESDYAKDVLLDHDILISLLEKSSSLIEAQSVLENGKFKDLPINKYMLYRLLGKATSIEEAFDLLNAEKFKHIAPDSTVLIRLIGKTPTVQDALGLLRDNIFKDVLINRTVLLALINRCKSTLEVRMVVDFVGGFDIRMGARFFRYLSTRLTNYEDLRNINIFWENYKRFGEFAYLDEEFDSLQKVKDFFNQYDYVPNKFLWNHIVSVWIDNALLDSLEQAESFANKLYPHFKAQNEGDSEFSEFYFNKYLFADIKQKWDHYKLGLNL